MGQFGKCYFINQESRNCDFTPMKLQVVPTSIYCKDWFVKKKSNNSLKALCPSKSSNLKVINITYKKCNKPTHSKVFVKAFQLCFNTRFNPTKHQSSFAGENLHCLTDSKSRTASHNGNLCSAASSRTAITNEELVLLQLQVYLDCRSISRMKE